MPSNYLVLLRPVVFQYLVVLHVLEGESSGVGNPTVDRFNRRVAFALSGGIPPRHGLKTPPVKEANMERQIRHSHEAAATMPMMNRPVLTAPMHQELYEVRPGIVVRSNLPFFNAPVPVDAVSPGSPALMMAAHSSGDIKLRMWTIGGLVLTSSACGLLATISAMISLSLSASAIFLPSAGVAGFPTACFATLSITAECRSVSPSPSGPDSPTSKLITITTNTTAAAYAPAPKPEPCSNRREAGQPVSDPTRRSRVKRGSCSVSLGGRRCEGVGRVWQPLARSPSCRPMMASSLVWLGFSWY